MHFDVPTAMMVTSLLTFCVGAGLSFATSHYPAALRQALRAWIGGLFLQTIALLAVALAEPPPHALLLVVGNSMYALALLQMLRAMRLFASQRNDWLPLLLVGAVVLNSLVFGAFWPAIIDTVRLNALPLALLQWMVVRAVVFARNDLRRADYLTALLFGSGAVLALARGTIEWIVAPDVAPELHRTAASAVFVFGSILPMLGTIGFMLMCADRLSDDLARLAMIDPLTGAYNRRTLVERARAVIAEVGRTRLPLALLAIDVDHFKEINDAYGHDTGDGVLIDLVRLMRESLDSGHVLSRIGGEEFAVLMPGLDEAEASVVAERVRRHVAETALAINGNLIRLRISIGVSALGPGIPDLAALLRHADRALYAAKRAGRDRVVIASALPSDAAAAVLETTPMTV